MPAIPTAGTAACLPARHCSCTSGPSPTHRRRARLATASRLGASVRRRRHAVMAPATPTAAPRRLAPRGRGPWVNVHARRVTLRLPHAARRTASSSLALSAAQIKCGHARRSGPPPAGSGQRLHRTSARALAAAGHDPGPSRGRIRVGGMGVAEAGARPVGRARFCNRFGFNGLEGGRSRYSLRTSRSLRAVRVAPVFVSGHPRTGQARRANAVGWPSRGWSYPSRILVGRAAIQGAAAGGSFCAAGPSRPRRGISVGRAGGIKTINAWPPFRVRERREISNSLSSD